MSNEFIVSTLLAIVGFILSGLIGLVIYFLRSASEDIKGKLSSIESDVQKLQIELIEKVSEVDKRLSMALVNNLKHLKGSQVGLVTVFDSVNSAMGDLKVTMEIVKKNVNHLESIDKSFAIKIVDIDQKIKDMVGRITVIESQGPQNYGKVIKK